MGVISYIITLLTNIGPALDLLVFYDFSVELFQFIQQAKW